MEEAAGMKPDPKVRATPRPVRIAYFLQEGPDSHSWLDAVFADCFSRDGGRQSLVIPVAANGAIPDRYLQWFQFLDPDHAVLMTYDNTTLAKIITPLLPETVLNAHDRTPGVIEDHPGVSIEPRALTSISWLPFLKVVSGWHRPAPAYILDAYPSWNDDGLISDNFGTPQQSHLGFPAHQQFGIPALLLTPPDAPSDRWHMKAEGAIEVDDAYKLLSQMSKLNGVVSMAILSNLALPTSIPTHPWSSGFCLVVGDSLADRISCWNAGLLFDDAHGQSYKTMRVPTAAVPDEFRTSCVAEFLRRRNWIGNSPPRILVRSHSLGADALSEFLVRLRAITHSIVTFEPINADDDCCPHEPSSGRGSIRFGAMSSESSDTSVREASTTLLAPTPKHLSYCAGQHPMFSQGAWYVDLRIDRLNDVGRFSNVREPWFLPARRQIVRSFCTTQDARITRRGNISVPIDVESLQLDVTQPTDDAFFIALLVDRNTVSTHDLRGPYLSVSTYRYCDVSDKGRYLQGALGLFGDLHSAATTLGNHFWRSQLLAMAAPGQAQQQEVVDDLKRRLRATGGIAAIDSEAAWQHLAERVIQKATRLRVPRNITRFSRLLNAWAAEISIAIDTDAYLRARRDEIQAEAPNDLRRSLSYLLDRKVFYRGHEWVCQRCSHRNWVDIDGLRNIVPCVVCEESHLVPVDLELDLRLNEFLAACLREHDTLTVISALDALQDTAQTSFLFHPQTNLYRDYPENQGDRIDREVDLVCMLDGQLVIGEAKANVNLIRPSDIADMATAAKEVGADVIVLAALTGERATLDSKVSDLRGLVGGSVRVRGLLSTWDDRAASYL